MISNYIFILDALAKSPPPSPTIFAKMPTPQILQGQFEEEKKVQKEPSINSGKTKFISFSQIVPIISVIFSFFFWSIIWCVFLSFLLTFLAFQPQKIGGYLKENKKAKNEASIIVVKSIINHFFQRFPRGQDSKFLGRWSFCRNFCDYVLKNTPNYEAKIIITK